MTINDIRDGDNLTVAPEGRLDTLSAPELDAHLAKYYPAISRLVFDFEKLDYISSAGLRVVLKASSAMQSKGGVTVRHANALVRQVFEITGFSDFLHFED